MHNKTSTGVEDKPVLGWLREHLVPVFCAVLDHVTEMEFLRLGPTGCNERTKHGVQRGGQLRGFRVNLMRRCQGRSILLVDVEKEGSELAPAILRKGEY